MDFSAEEISSDGTVLLLGKIERENRLLRYFSKVIPVPRDPFRTVHSVGKLLKQQVFTLMHVCYLKNAPLLKDILDGDLASQPTISRFENRINKQSIFALCYAWIERYIESLKGRKSVTIDIDATDDLTYGAQQLVSVIVKVIHQLF